jgi:hypothetical protein
MMSEMARRVLADRFASPWLKDAVRAAFGRDPVEALRDAEALAAIMRERVAASRRTEAQGAASRSQGPRPDGDDDPDGLGPEIPGSGGLMI